MRKWLLIGVLVALAALWRAGRCGVEVWRGDDLALVCVGVDPVRLWPWPLRWPYPEDGPEGQNVDLTISCGYDKVCAWQTIPG